MQLSDEKSVDPCSALLRANPLQLNTAGVALNYFLSRRQIIEGNISSGEEPMKKGGLGHQYSHLSPTGKGKRKYASK
jgi:hypothetical protein